MGEVEVMTTKTEIVEAMARALAAHSTGGICAPDNPDLEWQCWVQDSEAALNAALPLIREAMAEAVRGLYPLGSRVLGDAPDRIASLIADWEPVPDVQEGGGDGGSDV